LSPLFVSKGLLIKFHSLILFFFFAGIKKESLYVEGPQIYLSLNKTS